MRRISKNIRGRSGRLYVVVDGNRYRLAQCKIDVSIFTKVVA